MNTGKLKIDSRYIKFGFPGFPDLFGFLANGRIFFCEVKTGTGKLSPKQRAFKRTALAFSCHYLECRSLKDFDEFYNSITTGLPQVIPRKTKADD